MSEKPISVLLIEDNPGDARLIKEMMKESGTTYFEFEHADRLSSGLEMLANHEFDIILLDLNLPDSEGLDTLKKVLPHAVKVPIIILTGSLADEMAGIQAIQEGAQDYLTKNQLQISSLIRSIRYAIERKQMEKELRALNESLEQRIAERTAALVKANEELQIKIKEQRQTEEKLKHLTDTLEQQVRERTAALTKANKELREEIAERRRIEETLRQTEIKLRQVTNSISDYLWSAEIDETGKISHHYYSPVVEKITGRPPEFYMQGPECWFSTIHPDDRTKLEKTTVRIRTGQSHHEEDEYRIIRPDGTVRWVRDSVIVKRNENGTLHLHGVVSDITERKHSEERLKKYEILFSEIKDLAYICDTQGNILFVNCIFEKLTGHKPEEFIGKPFAPLFDEENQKKGMDVYQRTLKGESPQYKLRFKDTGILCEYKNLPLRDEKGKITGVIGTARDITKQNRVEEALRKSEERLRTVVTGAPVILWALDKKGIFTLSEGRGLDALGIKPGEFVGKSVFDVFDTQVSEIREKFEHALKSKESTMIIELTGVIFEVRSSLHYNPDNEVIGLIGVATDITERKRIEKDLRALNETLEKRVMERTSALVKASEELSRTECKHKMLLENLPQKICYKDKNSTYVSCNENYAKDLHITSDGIFGKTDYDFYPKELADQYRKDDARIMKSGQTEELQEKYIRDGKEHIINTIKTSVRDKHGTVIGILSIFWDITEKIALEKEAIHNRQLAALGELATGVGHEINNPVTGIINCAQILFNKSMDGSKEKDLARRIIKEGDRIANIVSRLLSFARPGNKNERKDTVSINEILVDTLILSEAQLRKEGIRLKVNIPSELPGVIVHPQQIQQVFLNIMSNARYALNQKYPKVHNDKILEISGVEITTDNRLYVKVIFYDHGTGIPSDTRDKVMDPFFTTKPRGSGTGLGLSISHSIIRDHDGKLIIDSVEGKFTQVAVILPGATKTP
ncbi:MAG: PAS domain S-box protein [wastewater metagenome]|nr:PAS domain S-box protein [Candidatus Loosdrechtia aerotolerans]